MANVTRHGFVSAVPDGPDANLVRPSNWNAEHVFSGGVTGQLLAYNDSESDNVEWIDAVLPSVVSFNAVGDGLVDDSAAFSTALATETHLAVPPGTYRIGTNLTIPVGTALQFSRGAVLSIDSGIVLTVNGVLLAGDYQILSGVGVGATIFARTANPYINVTWLGAVGDDSNDDSAAITNAARIAALRISGGRPFSGIYFPGQRIYRITVGIPITQNVYWFSDGTGMRGFQFRMTGSQSAVYSATVSAGVFTDNLNANISQVLSTQGCPGVSISGLAVDHTGTISGNAPSGQPWDAAVHLVGVYDSTFTDLRIDCATANADGLRLRHSFRSRFFRPIMARGSVVTGGVGFYVLEQNNNFSIDNPSILGPWASGITVDRNGDALNGGVIINPNVEGVVTGNGTAIKIDATAIAVLGGFIENCKISIELGTIAGEAAVGCQVDRAFIGTNANNDYLVRLLNVQNSLIRIVPQPGYTVNNAAFQSGTIAQGNTGNVVEWFQAAADTPPLTSLGLNQGGNIVRVYGNTNDIDGYQEYYTTSTALVNRMERHFNRVIAEDYLRLGAVAQILYGTGTPEGVVTAAVGSLFLRTDGGAGTTLYVKQSGAGNTGWVGK